MIKKVVHAWRLFRKEGRNHKGNHRFYCKRHKKILNGSHCYVCYNYNLKNTKHRYTSRVLCKRGEGIVPPTDFTRRIRMTKRAFIILIKKYRRNVRKLLRSNKR